MTIPSAFQREPTPALSGKQVIVDIRSGLPTPYFVQVVQQQRADALGAARQIPCSASGTNVITLTPNHPVAPLLQGYRDFDTFVFVAAATSTGAVTATVVPEVGTLATLKLYKDGGSTQAGSGDIVQGRLYSASFNDALDSGAGGLVILGLVTPATIGGAPDNAQYLTLAANGGLSAERVLTPGAGLTGTDGGANSTYTLNVGAGTGVTVNADDVALDTTHLRNVDHSAVSVTAGAGLTGGGTIAATRTIDVGAGTGINVAADSVGLDTTSTRNTDHASVTLTAGGGLTGGGDIAANRTFAVGAGTGITVNADDVAIDLAYLAEAIDDRVDVLIQDGSGITWTYNDGANTLTPNLADFLVSISGYAGIADIGFIAHIGASAAITRTLTGGANISITNGNGVSGEPEIGLTQGVALSVLGVAGNATADHADIAAASDFQVLRRSGTAIAFGAIDLSQPAAVTGDLPFANLAQGTARSVLAVAGNATADFASVQGTASQFLGINSAGTALAFQTMSGDATLSAGAITIKTDVALAGNPTTTTQAVDNNTTRIATTAFVLAQAASATPLVDAATAVVGTSTRYARGDHVHPIDNTASTTTTPTPTPGSGAFTTVSCTLHTKTLFGKFTLILGKVTITTNGTAGGSINVPLPVTASYAIAGWGVDANTGDALGISVSSSTAFIFLYNHTYPGVSGHDYNFGMIVEIA